MKRAMATAALALGIVCAGLAAAERGVAELVLFDAPKGGWLGSVRDDADLVVLEERDGWRRVRIEGWVRGPAAPATAPPVTAPPAAPAPSVVVAPAAETAAPSVAPRLANVQGILAPDPGAGGTAGSGILVLLVKESETLETEHRKAGADCKARLEEEDRKLERLKQDADRALNSSENFREASTRSDQARARLAVEQKARRDLLKDCRARAQGVFEKGVAARAISDPAGRFEFPGVAPGRYRAVAFEAVGDSPRVWSYSFQVEASAPRVLDPAADRSPSPADWGLR